MSIEEYKIGRQLKKDILQIKLQTQLLKLNQLQIKSDSPLKFNRRSTYIDKNEMNQIHNKEYEFQILINIMAKHHRSMIEIHVLANYLGQLEELTKFFKLAHENYKELLVTTSCSLRHEFTKKGKILFKFGKDFI